LWLKGVTNSKTWGFGFNCPSQNYVSSFPDNDPRKRATILFENDTVLFDINPATNDTSWEILDPKCQQANCNGPSPTGYYEKKYFVTDYDCRLSGSDPKNGGGWFEHGSGAKNICVFRYADILLLASEAALHLGNTTKALNYINQVRTRARNSGNTGFPKNITSITLDSIYNERKWEFGSEGYRLYDLIRTREAYNKLKGIKKAGLNASVMFDSTRNYLFPIPIISIADSKGVLSQNPGYKGWQDIGILAPKKGIQTVEYTIDTTLTSNITPGAVVEFSINFNYELMDPAKLNFNEILNATVIKKKLISGLKDSTIRSGISMDYTMGKSYKDFSDTLVVLLSNVKSQTIDTVLLNVKFIGSKTQIISNTNLERQIKIYPNPVKDIFNLDLSEEIALPVIMKIYSIDGIEVFATKLNSRSSNINLSKLGAGIYILKVVDNNQAIKINKR